MIFFTTGKNTHLAPNLGVAALVKYTMYVYFYTKEKILPHHQQYFNTMILQATDELLWYRTFGIQHTVRG